ncbi:PREDICTED: cytochrome P450 CYP736A12-like [Tarenaya hassleriana]|uniref:cytochrome P450 CYP736A12-like n=1 Tax=Tarenaya hassleriana TaxID=28532 RepID=UPI00053C3CC2|nr:PREDICTED: cytochrome P450 CYP736A12-like [Tarenaya hassleriana]
MHTMSPSALALILLVLLASFSLLFRAFSPSESSRNFKKLPPGPRGMPIVGHLHMLGKLPHQTLAHLAKKYGPIMSIRLGSVRTIVVSSPRAAELFLKTHDNIFASRPKAQAPEIMSYGTKAMALQPYGPYWRNVRKLCVVHLLSASKIEQFKPVRTEEIGLLMNHLKMAAEKNEVVNVSKILVELLENLLYRLILGRGKNDDDDVKLKELVEEIVSLTGAFNISDYLPLLAPLDLQGLARRMRHLSKSMDIILENIIEEHEQQNRDHKSKDHKDFVDVLLSLLNQPMNEQDEHSEIIGRTHVKSILLDMVAAALETSATAIEWIFSEILKNTRIMKKLQDELKNIVGMDRMVNETDLSKLTYLDMVIKEGFRLHPVAPLLIPHESVEDVVLDGFYIPKKSRVLVNVWSIGRDRDVWGDNNEEFNPERFENDDIDINGLDFRLIPFGSGRRRCPGMQMGLLNLRLVIAQLVHCFDWVLPVGMVREELDMNEKFGLTVGRANNVFATPIYRLNC